MQKYINRERNIETQNKFYNMHLLLQKYFQVRIDEKMKQKDKMKNMINDNIWTLLQDYKLDLCFSFFRLDQSWNFFNLSQAKIL